jgi:hypothetical protein
MHHSIQTAKWQVASPHCLSEGNDVTVYDARFHGQALWYIPPVDIETQDEVTSSHPVSQSVYHCIAPFTHTFTICVANAAATQHVIDSPEYAHLVLEGEDG